MSKESTLASSDCDFTNLHIMWKLEPTAGPMNQQYVCHSLTFSGLYFSFVSSNSCVKTRLSRNYFRKYMCWNLELLVGRLVVFLSENGGFVEVRFCIFCIFFFCIFRIFLQYDVFFVFFVFLPYLAHHVGGALMILLLNGELQEARRRK